MLENDLKNKRKCSVCREFGHDKRKCLKVTKTENKINTRKNSVVSIEVGKLHKRSPHLVNLRIEKKEDEWGSKIDIYNERALPQKERNVVDLAQMVRSANAESGMKNAKIENKEKIIAPVRMKETINIKHVSKKEKVKFRNPKFCVLSFMSGMQKKVASSLSGVGQAQKDFVSAFSIRRFAYSAIVILLLITIPFPAIGYYNQIKDTGNRVIEESTNAFLSLQASTVAALNSNLNQAQFDLNLALESFGNASSILEKEHRALQFVAGVLPVIGTQINSRQNLLIAGHHLALGNTYLVKGIKTIDEEPNLAMTDKITILASHLRGAIPQYQEALIELGGVDSKVVPVEYQASFNDFKILFATFVDDMQDIINLADSVEIIFGGSEFRRYLLVFQNNDELRPTGGFMGSFAIMDVQKGKILNLDVPGGGTYDLQGQLDKYVSPPLPLQLINNRWEFQDANWFPDFPASAKKMAWFYEHGRGATVDGVIAINATVLERMLKVLGPIVSQKHDLVITSDDALEKLQYQVEVDYDKEENRPKDIIGDLANQFVDNLPNIQATDAVRLLSELNEALRVKEIQVYFNDSDLENKMSDFGWTGELSKVGENQDYLQVINTNIAGAKTDAKIEQTIDYQSVIQADGSIINTVVVERKHTGIDGQKFYGENNVNYIRLYVPEGAELLEAGGFVYPPEDLFKVPEAWYKDDIDLLAHEQEIDFHKGTGTRVTNEFGKTAFGNWMMTAPGKTSKVYFVYRLPFKLDLEQIHSTENKWEKFLTNFDNKLTTRYSLLVQKQSGIDSIFSAKIICPDQWLPVWQSGDNVDMALNGIELQTMLETDRVIGLVMEKGESN